VQLAVHRIGPRDGVPVILAPGTFTSSAFWLGTRGTGFARVLADAGFESWVLDFRGHGASARPLPSQRWRFDDWGRRDLPAAIATVNDEGRTPFIVGHSAGGASTLAALAADAQLQKNVRGAIIVATPLPWLQRWRRVAAYTMRLAAQSTNYFPARLLRLGPEDELSGVMEQWMDWNLRGQWIGTDGTDYVSALARLHVPLLFIAGEGDTRFAPPPACLGLFDRVGSLDRRFVLASRDAGYLRDYGHVDLLVSREAREEIWPLMIRWLGDRTTAPGRTAGPA
jgi:predicted alpha/beta hydrolase